MRRLLFLLVLAAVWFATAHAETDLLVKAIQSAFTDRDPVTVETIDRTNCIFNVDGRLKVYLNNIYVGRIAIGYAQEKDNLYRDPLFTALKEVKLQGDPVVVEETDFGLTTTITPRTTYIYRFYNAEIDNLYKAWRDIYANGCVGKKSPS